MIKTAIGVTDDGQNLLMLLTYIGNEMYDVYGNIVTLEKPTLTQVNADFQEHFATTSNSAYKCYLFRKLKQQHDKTIHEFYIHFKEQGQKYGFTDLI